LAAAGNTYVVDGKVAMTARLQSSRDLDAPRSLSVIAADATVKSTQLLALPQLLAVWRRPTTLYCDMLPIRAPKSNRRA
jgi:hypothetical protein